MAAEFDQRGVEAAWAGYFEWETALAASGAVDVLAHVDVVKKQGYRLAEEPLHLYDGVAAAAAASGTAVEVNSNGLNSPAREVYPAPAFLKAFFEAGVPITLGSDAHSAEHAGRDLDEAVAAARAAGYATRLRFDQRAAVEVALE